MVKTINGYEIRPHADLIGADLRYADLKGENLYDVLLSRANLYGADLSGADLSYAYLDNANLAHANLNGANLYHTNLHQAHLKLADLTSSNVTASNLSEANLIRANLTKASISYSDLESANLAGANLKDAHIHKSELGGVKGLNTSAILGLLNPSDWMKETFESTSEGYIVYKFFGRSYYPSPSRWLIEENSIIEEVPNLSPYEECGSGINFATLEWVRKELGYKEGMIWRCLLKWEDLASLCVPYSTDGKARCGKLTLIEPIG